MTPSSPSREILQPVANHYYHDGAACVPLSPTAGTRNAVILYSAFKGMSGKTILRADFNGAGKPYAYFAGKEKKLSHLAETNIRAERAEMANILSSIGTAAKKKFVGNSHVYRAAARLKMITFSKTSSDDFRIGDIRVELGVIVKAHAASIIAEAHERKAEKNRTNSPHSPHSPHSPEIRDQRLRQFIRFLNEKPEASTALVTALDPRAEQGDFAAVAALVRVKSLIKDYLELPAHKRIVYQSLRTQKEEKALHSPGKKSLTAFIKRYADEPDLKLFARLWKKMRQDDTLRGLIGIHSWAGELALIADVILGAEGGAEGGISGGHKATTSRIVYQKNPKNVQEALSEEKPSSAFNSGQPPEAKHFQRDAAIPDDEASLLNARSSANDSFEIDSPFKGFLPSSQQRLSSYELDQSFEYSHLEIVAAPASSGGGNGGGKGVGKGIGIEVSTQAMQADVRSMSVSKRSKQD